MESNLIAIKRHQGYLLSRLNSKVIKIQARVRHTRVVWFGRREELRSRRPLPFRCGFANCCSWIADRIRLRRQAHAKSAPVSTSLPNRRTSVEHIKPYCDVFVVVSFPSFFFFFFSVSFSLCTGPVHLNYPFVFDASLVTFVIPFLLNIGLVASPFSSFKMFSSVLFLGLASLVHAHAGHHHVHRRQEAGSGLQTLFDGNARFVSKIQSANPTLLADLTANGQEPPFMFIGCSDSRVSEGTIFDADPGTLFTERNIANQFSQNDANAHTIMSYAVAELGVQHVIVMGHYGCGGVAAAIATPPEGIIDAANGAIQNWIAPIRAIFETSTRPEIVALRESIAGVAVVEEPEPEDPGFRALVEENVKASVKSIASSSVIKNHFAALAEGTAERKRAEGGPLENVFIHGFVYDIANGQIQDLGISVGPPGVEIPAIPFSAVGAAVEAAATESAASEASATESAAAEATPTASAAAEATATESAAASTEEVKPLENAEGGSSGEAVTLKCKEQCKSKRRLQKRLSGDY